MPRRELSSPSQEPFPPVPPFVGRQAELEALVAALPRPRGRGGVVLIRGEPGSGKSRLTEQLALVAREHGVRTIVGRCWDSGAPPFWPWVHALRSLPGMPRTTDLTELVAPEAPPGIDRFGLFDATAELLSSFTAEVPLVIGLDDLHDADIGSLVLARFLQLELDRIPVLMIGTYRPAELARRPQLAEHLGELERLAGTIDLGGLSVAEVADLIADPTVAAEVHRHTGGNPLFVLHHLDALGGDGEAGPGPGPGAAGQDPSAGLRQAVRAWLRPLDPSTKDAVAAIGLLGPTTATIDLVAALTGSDVTAVGEQVTEAMRAGVVRSADDRGELQLAHPLIAEVLVADLDEATRTAWHLTAARALADTDGHSSEVAGHLIAAGSGHEAAALSAVRRSAARASVALAHEEAVAHLETAIELLDALPGDQRVARCELLLDLGTSRWRANAHPTAEAAFAEATELAIELGDSRAQAVAAIGGGYVSDLTGERLARRADLLRAALDALPEGDSALRARLLADLVTNELPTLSQVEAIRRADEALTMARRVGDDAVIGYALVARLVVELGPKSLDARLEACREVLSLARRTGEHGLALLGWFHLVGALLEAGDLRSIDLELVAHRRAIDQIAEPAYTRHALWFRVMRLIVSGQAELAESTAERALAAAEAASDPDAFQVYGGQLAVIRWLQGRVGEMEQLWVDLRREEPTNPLWIATLAWLWATSGQIDAARGAIRSMVPLDELDQDRHWLLIMSAFAEAVAIVEDRDLAQQVTDRLLPYADRVVPISAGIAWWGTVARPLGLLALALGRPDTAAEHLSAALELTSRLGARPWTAQIQLELAELDLRRGVASSETGRLVAEASATIETYGPMELRGHAADLLREVAAAIATTGSQDAPEVESGGSTGPVDDGRRRPRVNVLGAFEVIADDGSTARWTSRKARELLKVLVARRGVPIPREQLMELLWPEEDPAVLGNRLSVALSTIRRALDPSRRQRPNELVAVDGDAVRLRLDNVDVDLEELLADARAALTAVRVAERTGTGMDEAYQQLGRVLSRHHGDALGDEPYADWAEPVRGEARSAIVAVARNLARLAEERDDDLLAVSAHRRILGVDPYDDQAHLGLIDVFEKMGAHGQARQARQARLSAREEMGAPVDLGDRAGGQRPDRSS